MSAILPDVHCRRRARNDNYLMLAPTLLVSWRESSKALMSHAKSAHCLFPRHCSTASKSAATFPPLHTFWLEAHALPPMGIILNFSGVMQIHNSQMSLSKTFCTIAHRKVGETFIWTWYNSSVSQVTSSQVKAHTVVACCRQQNWAAPSREL